MARGARQRRRLAVRPKIYTCNIHDRVKLPSFHVHTAVTKVTAHSKVHYQRGTRRLAGLRRGRQPPGVICLLQGLAQSRACHADLRQQSEVAPGAWLGRSDRHSYRRATVIADVHRAPVSPRTSTRNVTACCRRFGSGGVFTLPFTTMPRGAAHHHSPRVAGRRVMTIPAAPNQARLMTGQINRE